MGRASRRRWTLIFPALLCFLAWIAVTTYRDGGSGIDTLALVAPAVVLGMLRRSTRRLRALDHPERDRAFRLAYPVLVAVLVISCAVLAVALPDAAPRRVPGESGGTVSIPGSFLQLEVLIGLALWLALWAAFLPAGVLAWCASDALEPDAAEPAPRLSEAARDGLLAGALAAGCVLGLVQPTEIFALLPLVGVLALIGLLARSFGP